MTLRNVLGGKEYKRIEYNIEVPKIIGEGTVFFGSCSYVDGNLKSLDGDTYSLDDEIISYREIAGSHTVTGEPVLSVVIPWGGK